MPDEITSYYIPFTAKSDDSRRIVEGYVSSGDVDCDNQIVDQEWLKAELPAWLAAYGNVREQHNPQRAVGKAQSVDITTQPGPYLSAKIVDDDAWRKVQAGVYNGFSVGIKAPRIVYDGTARNGRIAGGKLIEISIVDRPANEAARFVVLKRAGERAWRLGESGPVVEEEHGMAEQEQQATAQEAALDAAPGAALTGASDLPAPPRPAAIGEVMAMLRDVQARVAALAGETDEHRDGDRPEGARTPANLAGEAVVAPSEEGGADSPVTPAVIAAPPLALSFGTEAELTKFITTRVEGLLAERAPSDYVTKSTVSALSEPLAAIPEIAKLAGGIARGLEALAGRTKATAEALAETNAAIAATQADLARVKELAQPVKGAVFAIEKGIGLEPDRIYRDGVLPESAKRGAEAAKVLAGLSDEERRQVGAAVLSEMYRARA
jgi:phage head maturation protease